MQQALLKVTSNLGTSPARQRTPTRPPGDEETTRAAAILCGTDDSEGARNAIP